MSEPVIEHFGVKGMKWGVRRNLQETSLQSRWRPGDTKIKTIGGENRPPSIDAVRAHQAKRLAAKSGVKALSNEDLQMLVTRMNLEQQYNRLNTPEGGNKAIASGKKFVSDILLGIGKQQAMRVGNDYAAKRVSAFLGKK